MQAQPSRMIFEEQPDFVRRYQAVGLIAAPDEQDRLNLFRLFLSSTTKRTLEEFIAYQKERNGIQVRVEPLSAEKRQQYAKPLTPPKPPTWEDIQPFGRPQPQGIEINFGGGKINVGISRWYIATPKPYKITYDIDPQLFGITIVRNSTHSYQFTGNNAFVSCRLEKAGNNDFIGNVDVYIKELSWRYGWITRQSDQGIKNKPNGQSIFANHPAQFTGEWMVEVVGKAPHNEYRITYERIIEP